MSETLTFEFPDDESLARFVTWLSDGGGEQEFFRFELWHAKDGVEILEFEYAGCLAKHGPRKVLALAGEADESNQEEDNEQ